MSDRMSPSSDSVPELTLGVVTVAAGLIAVSHWCTATLFPQPQLLPGPARFQLEGERISGRLGLVICDPSYEQIRKAIEATQRPLTFRRLDDRRNFLGADPEDPHSFTLLYHDTVRGTHFQCPVARDQVIDAFLSYRKNEEKTFRAICEWEWLPWYGID